MSLVEFAKEAALSYLPPRLLKPARKVFYAITLKNSELTELMDGAPLEALLRPGDYVADIGASVGYYTKVFADIVGPGGHVYCVEPLPMNIDVVRFNLLVWGLTNVELIGAAVSDSASTTTMTVPSLGAKGANYEGRLSAVSSGDDGGERVEVHTRPMDDIFGQGFRRIDVIKLDAMGHELACLYGGHETVERQRPAWLIAIYTDPNDEASKAAHLFKLMRETYEYGIYWFDEASGRLRSWRPGVNNYRFFFLQDTHLERLRRRGVEIVGDADR